MNFWMVKVWNNIYSNQNLDSYETKEFIFDPRLGMDHLLLGVLGGSHHADIGLLVGKLMFRAHGHTVAIVVNVGVVWWTSITTKALLTQTNSLVHNHLPLRSKCQVTSYTNLSASITLDPLTEWCSFYVSTKCSFCVDFFAQFHGTWEHTILSLCSAFKHKFCS